MEPPAVPALVARPYPVDRYVTSIPNGATVAVEGMGLVATDVVMALTLGRGGTFTESGDRLRYVRSGDEPSLRLFSRSGFPYTAKAVATVDESDEYEAVVCTRQAVAAVQGVKERAAPGARSTSAPRFFP